MKKKPLFLVLVWNFQRTLKNLPVLLCLKGVRANSILCSVCNLWMHKNCGIMQWDCWQIGQQSFVCFLHRLETAHPIDGRPVANFVVNDSELNAEKKFCYLVLKPSRPIALLLWVNLENFCQSSTQNIFLLSEGKFFLLVFVLQC